jgi:pyruvate dehydrogenase E1 component alpha subunit
MAQVQTEAKPIVNRTQALVWLRQMMLIRRFEERAEMLYQKGNKIGGFFHQYSGQEPVAVGSIGVLRENDYIITAYRDHGHALARGMSAREGMAELLGKVTGCSRGKGGSMHFFDAEKGFLGGHAIVGSHIPLATGVAGCSVEATCDLHRREQPVRDGNFTGKIDGRPRPPAARGHGLWHSWYHHRWQRYRAHGQDHARGG